MANEKLYIEHLDQYSVKVNEGAAICWLVSDKATEIRYEVLAKNVHHDAVAGHWCYKKDAKQKG